MTEVNQMISIGQFSPGFFKCSAGKLYKTKTHP